MSIFPKTLSGILLKNNILCVPRRYFLSNAFECTDAWNSRLSDPLFQKVKSDAMYYEMTSHHNRTKKINAIDVDIFACAQTDDLFITELEELVHNLRLCNEAHRILPSTPHALVRIFMDHKKEALPRILDDRLNYGIFPDDYLMLFLLNRYLKLEDYRRAAKIAALEMFQENFSNELVKYMSLYSVLKYLTTNEPWDDPVPKSDNDEEEEVIKVKIRILRNPFFDDHFDLKDGQHICGKTLAMIGSTMPDTTKNSIRIMGLALYNKWEKLEDLLKEINSSNKPIYLETLSSTKETVKSKLEDQVKKDQILRMIEELEKTKPLEGSLIDIVKKMIEEEAASSEQTIINNQIETYKAWNILRTDRLKEHYLEMEKRKRLEEVERKKEEIKLKEEELYFFENEDQIDLTIEKKELMQWKRRYFHKESTIEEDYVPPEARRKTHLK